MAWTNIPTFTVGQVLTSSTMNAMRSNANIGHLVCTSTSRPAGPDTGSMIYETDTGYTRIYDGSLWRQASPAPTVTSLPASPVDGDEVVYTAEATNGIRWRFKYRAASASSYKWEFVGGAPLRYDGGYGWTWGSWVACNSITHQATGVSLTVPFAGDYDMTGSAISYNAAGDSLHSIALYRTSYGAGLSWNYTEAAHYGQLTYQAATMVAHRTLTLTASENVKLTMAVSNVSYTGYFYGMTMYAYPVRVG